MCTIIDTTYPLQNLLHYVIFYSLFSLKVYNLAISLKRSPPSYESISRCSSRYHARPVPNNLDATLIKTTAIREGISLKLYMNVFNVLNRQFRGTPDSSIEDVGTFGTNTSNSEPSAAYPLHHLRRQSCFLGCIDI